MNLPWEVLLRSILQQHAVLRPLSLRSSRRGLSPKPTGMCFPMEVWGAKLGVCVHKGAAHCWREGPQCSVWGRGCKEGRGTLGDVHSSREPLGNLPVPTEASVSGHSWELHHFLSPVHLHSAVHLHCRSVQPPQCTSDTMHIEYNAQLMQCTSNEHSAHLTSTVHDHHRAQPPCRCSHVASSPDNVRGTAGCDPASVAQTFCSELWPLGRRNCLEKGLRGDF